MPRVELDIDQCLKFVRKQPWGKPNDRRLDIWHGIKAILTRPEWFSVAALRRETGLELRRYNVAQFVIVYAYIPPTVDQPGVVSIRAIRHRRVKDVFAGVNEPVSAYG